MIHEEIAPLANVVDTVGAVIAEAIEGVGRVFDGTLVPQPWPLWLVCAGEDAQWSDPMPLVGTQWEYNAHEPQVLNYGGKIGSLPFGTKFIRAFPTYEQANEFLREERKAQALR